MKTRGFTLIELLVVIAIIGLLASIILATLSVARNRGKDAAIESDLHEIMNADELLRSSGACYSATGNGVGCPGLPMPGATSMAQCQSNYPAHSCANVSVGTPFDAARTVANTLASFQEPAGAGSYAALVQLATDPALAWCVDSSGNSTMEGTAGGAALTQTTLNALTHTDAKGNILCD